MGSIFFLIKTDIFNIYKKIKEVKKLISDSIVRNLEVTFYSLDKSKSYSYTSSDKYDDEFDEDNAYMECLNSFYDIYLFDDEDYFYHITKSMYESLDEELKKEYVEINDFSEFDEVDEEERYSKEPIYIKKPFMEVNEDYIEGASDWMDYNGLKISDFI